MSFDFLKGSKSTKKVVSTIVCRNLQIQDVKLYNTIEFFFINTTWVTDIKEATGRRYEEIRAYGAEEGAATTYP